MTKQQRWALAALESVRSARSRGDASRYRTCALNGPSLIQQCGLVQALAFLRSRDDSGKQYVADLARLLAAGAADGLDVTVSKLDLPSYIAMTRDATSAAIWIRRFAQIELREAEEKSA